VLLSEWNLACEMFDGDVVSGPVPTLFSDRPDAAKVALGNDPEKAFQDLGKILRKLVIHEYVPPAAGWAIVLKPRYKLKCLSLRHVDGNGSPPPVFLPVRQLTGFLYARREAEVLLPFKKSGYTAPVAGPAPKRPRVEHAASETGTDSYCRNNSTISFSQHE
jgi:hypothetical protein